MHIRQLGILERDLWDAFVAQEPQFALMQSWDWGVFKEKLGWKAFRIAVEAEGQIVAGAQMLIKPLPGSLASLAYIPRGPVGNWLDEGILPALLDALHRLARSQQAIFLKIEPPLLNDPAIAQILQQHQFKPSSYTNQPRSTIILDLKQDLDGISQQIRKRIREYIRFSANHGVTLRLGGQEDLPAFFDLIKITAEREQFIPRLREYYDLQWQTFSKNGQAVLLMAYYQEQLLAVHMAFRFGEHAAYFHGGSRLDFRQLRPNHFLVWEAVKWAKAQGCGTYDLWGIPDEIGQIVSNGEPPPVPDRTDGLWGVYHFKSGFSKNIIGYIGAYDFVYIPALYPLLANKFINGYMFEQFAAWMDKFRHKER